MPVAKFLAIAMVEHKMKPADARSLLESQQHLKSNDFFYLIGDLAVSRRLLTVQERDHILEKQKEYGENGPSLPDPLKDEAPTGLESASGRAWFVSNCVVWIGTIIGVGVYSSWDIDLMAAYTVFGAAMLVALRDYIYLGALVAMTLLSFAFRDHVIAVASAGAVVTFVFGLIRDLTRSVRDPNRSRFSTLRWSLVLVTLVAVVYSISMASKLHELLVPKTGAVALDPALQKILAAKYWLRCWTGLACTSAGFGLVFALARLRQREVWFGRQKVESISESVNRMRAAIVELEAKPEGARGEAHSYRVELLQLLGLSIRRNSSDDFLCRVPLLNRLAGGATVWYLEVDSQDRNRFKICAFAAPGAPKGVLEAMAHIRESYFPVRLDSQKWEELLTRCRRPGSQKVDMNLLRRHPERGIYTSLAGRVFASAKLDHGPCAADELELDVTDLDGIPGELRTEGVNRWLTYRGGWAGIQVCNSEGKPSGVLMVFKNAATDLSVEDLLHVRTSAALLGLLN